jgi:uncharacterized membrane protein
MDNMTNMSANSSNFSIFFPETAQAVTSFDLVNVNILGYHRIMSMEELQPYIMVATLILCALFFLGGIYLGKSKYGQKLKNNIELRRKHA